VPLAQEKDTQTVDEPQAQRNQHIPSLAKVEGAQEITTQKTDVINGQDIPEV
jgi:hypothetical protein